MAPPFSARRPIPGIQPFFERRREITPPCVSSHYPRPRLVQLRGGIFERVRICTSHRAASWVPTSLACSGSSLSLEASTLARPAQGAFMGLTTRRRVSIPPPLNGFRPTSIFSPATWYIRLNWPLLCAQLHVLSFSRFNAVLSEWCHRPPHAARGGISKSHSLDKTALPASVSIAVTYFTQFIAYFNFCKQFKIMSAPASTQVIANRPKHK